MKRYEVQLILHCVEVNEDGARQEIMLPEGPKWNVPRTGLVAIQKLLIGVLIKIGDWGYNLLSAEEKNEVDKMVS